jgi:hypothetical protein
MSVKMESGFSRRSWNSTVPQSSFQAKKFILDFPAFDLHSRISLAETDA